MRDLVVRGERRGVSGVFRRVILYPNSMLTDSIIFLQKPLRGTAKVWDRVLYDHGDARHPVWKRCRRKHQATVSYCRFQWNEAVR